VVNIKELSTDTCIIGDGPAGYVSTIHVAQLGEKVTLIEERGVGGFPQKRFWMQ